MAQKCHCQGLDLKLLMMPWQDLKQAVYTQKPSNVAELKQYCKEEWATIPPWQCERLSAKCFIAVVATKGGTTSY